MSDDLKDVLDNMFDAKVFGALFLLFIPCAIGSREVDKNVLEIIYSGLLVTYDAEHG